MKIDVYISDKTSSKHLSVITGTDVRNLELSKDFDPDLLTLRLLKSEIEILPNTPYIALDSNDVINQIERNGYAVHEAKIEISRPK